MNLHNNKIGDLFLTENNQVAELRMRYVTSNYPSFDCLINDEMRIFVPNGECTSSNKGYNLKLQISKETHPEYFL